MFLIDQIKSPDKPLRWVARCLLGGLLILLGGLWYVQVVSAKKYQAHLDDQLLRSVREPALRGRILDRNGVALADNRPSYEIDLYLEELRTAFHLEYTNHVRAAYAAAHTGAKGISASVKSGLEAQARYNVVSNYLAQVSSALGEPLILAERRFATHYDAERTLPFPLMQNLTYEQVARFTEIFSGLPGAALEVQPIRVYPYGSTAAHLLGYIQRDEHPGDEDEEATYQFRLPDFKGVSGIESALDNDLRGKAGQRLVKVNSMAYRQSQTMSIEPTPGKNVTLTIDLKVQQAMEKALATKFGPNLRGAAIVMDVESGDIIAMASAPTFDPNHLMAGVSNEEWQTLNDEELRPFFNRATQGTYFPGSTFKIVVALAGLEKGTIDPSEIYHSAGEFWVGKQHWGDTAGKGDFDFRRAFYRSSNPYFQNFGLKTTVVPVVEMGRQLGLGEKTGIDAVSEKSGEFPASGALRSSTGGRWLDGDTANLCIGQGAIHVTALQMVVLASAVANGGKVLQPRLVMRLDSQSEDPDNPPIEYPAFQARQTVPLKPGILETLRQAMLDDVEHHDNGSGTGDGSGVPAYVEGLHIGGKTGTAQNEDIHGHKIEDTTWFVSYASYDAPRYAVVVVVEHGASGGKTCAPIAHDIYQALAARDPKFGALVPSAKTPAVSTRRPGGGG